MKMLSTLFGAFALLSLTSCDLNDTDDSGTTTLFIKAKLDGILWESNYPNATASVNNSGIHPIIILRGEQPTTGEFILIEYRQSVGADTLITGSGLNGIISFNAGSSAWTSTTGNFSMHEDRFTGNKHSFTGSFSGTVFDPISNTSKAITNGEVEVQGVF